MGSKINILLVDDDPDWIDIICNIIKKEDDLCVAATASNRENGVDAARCLQNLDVVLMDISLTEGRYDGLEAASHIVQITNARVIMLTAMGDREIILESIGLGASDYVVKDEVNRIPDAIRSVLKDTSVSKIAFEEINHLWYEINKYKKLTPSEKELYDYKEKGYSMLEISKIMSKSLRTIKNQLNRMYKKFGVTNFSELTEKIKE